MLDTRSGSPHPRVCKRMKIETSIGPSTAPRRFVEEDEVAAPRKLRMRPSKRIKSCSDHDPRTESNGASHEKPRRRRTEHKQRVVCRNVDVCGIDRQDLNIAPGIDHCIVRCRLQISVFAGLDSTTQFADVKKSSYRRSKIVAIPDPMFRLTLSVAAPPAISRSEVLP